MPFLNFEAILTWVQVLGYLLIFLAVAPLFPFLYVVVRWRGAGSGEGTRGAILYFCTVSLLLLLAGTANLLYGWVSTTPVEEFMTRLSYGLFFGSLAFLALNLLLLRRAGTLPDVRRVFLGFFSVMAGLISLTAIVFLCVTLFRETKDSAEEVLRLDELKLYGAWTLCFLGAYLPTVWRLSTRR